MWLAGTERHPGKGDRQPGRDEAKLQVRLLAAGPSRAPGWWGEAGGWPGSGRGGVSCEKHPREPF